MALELTGTIKEIFDTQTFTSGFSKREFVITTQEQYPQQVKFEMTKDRADIIESLAIGDLVRVSFNVRGNEYQGKYYVSLQGWKVEKNPVAEEVTGGAAPRRPSSVSEPKETATTPVTNHTPSTSFPESIEDDLPF